jgi:quercetin dioxygenase-like cupin family protein
MSETEILDLAAGEYALGALSDAERAAFEARLARDAEARAALARWRKRLAREASGEVAPSPRVWEAIKARLAEPAAPVTVRDAAGSWETISPGVAVKVLHRDAAAKRRSILVRLDPGAEYTAHEHHADKECMMISGDFSFDDGLELRAGDYHMMPAGRPHAVSRSRGGALLFVRQYFEAAA